jgi:hypothetical protein
MNGAATNNMVLLVRLVKSRREMGYESYMGEQDAKIAERWIGKVERTIIQINILEGLRVNCATETLTWSDVKTKFEN